MRVGFVGLGDLGSAMARRIARSGYKLSACDIRPAALDAFDEPGVALDADPLATAQGVDALCVCVRLDADLEALAGDGAVFQALGQGGLFIIHSTVAPELCRTLGARAKQHGVDVVDAGVSGGPGAALDGRLSIYVGGEPAAFERARPLLETLGKSVIHLGPIGRGMEGKLLNNLVSIANYATSAAILDLGERLGFEREALRKALLAGSADSFALRAIPGILRPETAAAMHELLAKDLAHARTLAPEADPAMAALADAAKTLVDRLAAMAASK